MKCPDCGFGENRDIDEFCGSCGHSFNRAAPQQKRQPPLFAENQADVEICPVKLEVKFGIPVPDSPCSLYWRLTNPHSRALTADLSYECKSLKFGENEFQQTISLPPGGSHQGDECFTAASGSYPIRFLVDIEGRRFSGHLDLSVSSSSANYFNIVAPAMQNHGGNVIGDHSTQMTITSGGEKRNHAEYSLVELRVSTVRRVVWKRQFALDDHLLSNSKRLVLLLKSGERTRRFVLFGGTNHVVGRGHACDLGLLCPRLEDPDGKRSEMLSRKHAEIDFSPDSVQWKELSSRGSELSAANGTRELLKSGENRPLSQGMKLSPAGVLPLKFKLYPAPQYLDTKHYSKFVQTELKKEYSEPAGKYHAVSIQREDSWSEEEEYLLLQHSTLIGKDNQCSIQLDCSSVQRKHAYLHFFGGNFWLERKSKKAVVKLEEKDLPLHYLAPLVEDMEIKLGNVVLTIESYSQKSR